MPLLVAHLVRREEGQAAFTRFLASYRRHPAGCDHDLVLLRKGFDAAPDDEWRPYQEQLGDLPHRQQTVTDEGFDLGAYRSFIPLAAGAAVLFLNSHSELLVDGWLDLLARHSGPGRLVGASGSWESHGFEPGPQARYGRLRQACAAFRAAWRQASTDHPPFPNPAIRTNAFLLPPDLHHLMAAWPVPRDKDACYALEAGRHGLSASVLAIGGELILAGADGRGHEPLDWPRAGIFRSGGQKHLIVGDNHTRCYAAAGAEERRQLGWCAWRSFHRLGGDGAS